MKDTYLTISKASEGLYKEKGSKFLAFAFPVQSVEQVTEILVELRKKYYDARHICYAYRLGVVNESFRINDDGEPSGTAGRPIYGQLLANSLTDILIVVIRYFGGILLGTGGLTVAYKAAAADAIANSKIEERIIEEIITIRCNYEQLNQVMRIIKEMQLTVITNQQNLDCHLTLRIRQTLLQQAIERFGMLQKVTLVHKESE